MHDRSPGDYFRQDGPPMTAPPRRIVIASPAEPSGASWLLNCLIELGIRVHHRPAAERLWRGAGQSQPLLWQREGERWRLHPRAAVMGKWLP
jgi:hypothetical protein